MLSVRDADFMPSAIACHDDLIYVTERPKNQIRIYDKLLRLLRKIYLNGIVVSNHHALAVNQNVRVLIDGLDSLALFNPTINANPSTNTNQNPSNSILTSTVPISKSSHRKKFNLVPENNRVNVCHFYKSMNCLEDVHVTYESKTKSYIYAVDSCSNEVKQFLYSKDERITLSNRFTFRNGKPISVTTSPLGYIFVLTDLPRKIYILDPKECDNKK